MSYPHLEALHNIAGLSYEADLNIRKAKERILEEYGFNTAVESAETLQVREGDSINIEDYLDERLNQNKYSAVLVRNNEWETMGGCPVVYVMSHQDLTEKLMFDSDGKIIQSKNCDAFNGPESSSRLNIYTRGHSIVETITGFENYDEERNVNIGGGFRLQLDGLVHGDGNPSIIFSLEMSFDDFGSRVLAKRNDEDSKVPMFSKKFQIPISDGKMVTAKSENIPTEHKTTRTVANHLMTALFQQNGLAIEKLFKDLMAVRPAFGVYQLEGIYGLRQQEDMQTEVIDFDGLESYDLIPDWPGNKTQEQIIKGQLIQNGFITRSDGSALVDYYKQKDNIESTISDSSDEINDSIASLVHFTKGEDMHSYFNRLSIYGRIARTLKYAGYKYDNDGNGRVRHGKLGDWDITSIMTGGFETAYLQHNGSLVEVNDIQQMRNILKQIIGSSTLNLCIEISKEGD
jgi:hypothetical protein